MRFERSRALLPATALGRLVAAPAAGQAPRDTIDVLFVEPKPRVMAVETGLHPGGPVQKAARYQFSTLARPRCVQPVISEYCIR
jgi:hypothetical protein